MTKWNWSGRAVWARSLFVGATALCACGVATDFAQPPVAVAPAPAPAPAPPPTLWNFLGIPQAGQRLKDAKINKSGNHPERERKPPLKRLADPANAQSDNPAIKAAAKIKAEEDLKCQKIKAIKYLGTIGCGCYDKVSDVKVSKALEAALDDCNEEVRFAAAQAIAKSVSQNCAQCSKNCCCNIEMMTKLGEVVYGKDEQGCWLEASDRVRAAACQALLTCCPNGFTPAAPAVRQGVQEVVPGPVETVPVTPPKPDVETVPNPVPPAPEAGAAAAAGAAASLVIPQTSAERTQAGLSDGTIAWVSLKSGTARLRFENTQHPEIGSMVRAYHRSDKGLAYLGEMQVVIIDGQTVLARPVGELKITEIGNGDEVMLSEPKPIVQPVSNLRVQTGEGSVAWISPKRGAARLQFEGDAQPEIGRRVELYHATKTGSVCLGQLEIVRHESKAIYARPIGTLQLSNLTVGDDVVLLPAQAGSN